MNKEIEFFFKEYADAMLQKDYEKEASMYEYPAAIFSDIGVRLVNKKDTLEFFKANEDYYKNYTGANAQLNRITVLSPKQVMADCVWHYTSSDEKVPVSPEAYIYILSKLGNSYKILGILMMPGNEQEDM